MWLWHGTQAVLFTVASSEFPLQPRSWATQSPSQDLFIYTLGLNFSGIQEVQQYGRVGRNGMSPTREMCTASKLLFPYFGNSWGLALNNFNVQGEKKVFLNILVRSTWRGKGESSAVNNIYNIVPGACKNPRRRFCTCARVCNFSSLQQQSGTTSLAEMLCQGKGGQSTCYFKRAGIEVFHRRCFN